MAIVDVRDVSILETDYGSATISFTVFLDQIATAPVEVAYFTQGGSASEQSGDFDDRSGTLTIQAGTDRTTFSTSVYADNLIEGNEFFDLYIMARFNAELAGGAAALRARAIIYDDDDAMNDPPVGDGGLAERVMGPNAEPGVLPTVDVRSVSLIEGNFNSDDARFLITLDRPATAPVTLKYYYQGIEASEQQGDFDENYNTVTIAAGSQSTWVSTSVYGDSLIEGNETFDLVIWDADNAQFPQGAVALRATATILDDDDADRNDVGGVQGFSEKIFGPQGIDATYATLSINDASVVEGDSGSDPARFLVTLDKPTPVDMRVYYSFENGTAVEALGDYDQTRGWLDFAAGQQASWISTSIYGDNLIEGDERFSLVLSNIENGYFEGGAALLRATGTIIDDDGGPISGPAGSGASADKVYGPAGRTDGKVVIAAANTSIIEGDSSSDEVGIYLTFSKALPTDITIQYDTISNSATVGDDVYRASGTWTIKAGKTSDVLFLRVVGDTRIEGAEAFLVRMNVTSGDAVFENGAINADATVTIWDNDDGVLSPGEEQPGPVFSEVSLIEVGGDGADNVFGGGNDDILYGDGIVVDAVPDVSGQVYRLYKATLDRAPDQGGHAAWTKTLFEGTRSLTEVTTGFVRSAEFQREYGALDNAGFVGLLYQNVLNRTASTAEVNAWVNVIAGGQTREGVVIGFSESNEFKSNTASAATNFAIGATAANWSDDVYRLYQATLDRAPDAAGFDVWIKTLSAGRDLSTVSKGFVASAEFQNTYGTLSDAAFVDQLYLNVLGRPADTAGKQSWLSAISGGLERENVVLGFSQSQEFRANTSQALETWMRGLQAGDKLSGGAGNDKLMGGQYADTFVFKANGGNDIVYDLEQWDSIDFTSMGFRTDAEARAQMTQVGGNIVFDYLGTNITFLDVQLAAISDEMLLV